MNQLWLAVQLVLGRGASLLALLCLLTPLALAQSPLSPAYDDTYSDLIGPMPLPDLFDPTVIGMELIEYPSDLEAALTKSSRCPMRKTADRGMPCAFVSYAPENTLKASYLDSLRPVFKVESDSRVWTFLGGELSLVPVAELWEVVDLDDPKLPGASYQPTSIVGYEENLSNCARRGREKCVDPSHFEMFVEKGYLTPACIVEIWEGRRGGPSGVGVQSRCRFNERG